MSQSLITVVNVLKDRVELGFSLNLKKGGNIVS